MKKISGYRWARLVCFGCILLFLFAGCQAGSDGAVGASGGESPDISAYLSRIAELEAEISALREQQYISDLEKNNDGKKNPAAGGGESDEEKAVFRYRVENGAAFITGYEGNVSMVSLPAALDGYPVRGIDDRAFEGAVFTTMTLPEGLERIGWFAFYDCRKLLEIFIPASVLQIGYGAFDGCERIRVVCPAGSFAEKCVKSYGLNYING